MPNRAKEMKDRVKKKKWGIEKVIANIHNFIYLTLIFDNNKQCAKDIK